MDTFTLSQSETLTSTELDSLAEPQAGWCVSLYLPTHRAGKEVREDPIRLKNLISTAESQLEEAGMPGGEIKRLLEPARSLCDQDEETNREFWQHQSDGLALFLSADRGEQFRLAESFPELAVVAHRFHVKPLLKAVQQDGQYCVLAVSRNGVRFLEGSRSGLSERPIDDLPESLQAVLGGEHHKGFNLHSFRVRSHSDDAAVPHGHVESNEEHELQRYFRTIDEALNDALETDKRPLVFAGVEELYPYFRDVSEYKNLVPEAAAGNPDEMSAAELHEQAWPLAEKVLQENQQEVLERWQAARQTDLGGTCVEEILVAAHDGRIDTLLLDADRRQWGTYDEESRSVETADEATAENYDIYDLAAVHTLRANGRVVMLDDSDAIGSQGIAAVYRYAAP